jgi:hypothetical protein
MVLCGALALAAAADAWARGGGGPWSEGFESYADGSGLVGQGGWTAWDDDPALAGATVTSEQAHSGAHSVRITDVDDTVQTFSGIVDGVWRLTAWVYVPSTMTDTQYFILLNDYNVGGAKDWSLDLELDGATGKVRDLESGSELDLVTDQWCEIECIFNLEDGPLDDTLSILINGAPLSSRDWSQGGVTEFEAIDLWGDNSTHFVYHDDLHLEALPETGACCDDLGACLDEQSLLDCDLAGGTFQGFGTLCGLVQCPVLGPDGWIVDAPLVWSDTTCDDDPICGLSGFAPDVQFEVTIPAEGDWTFSVCGASWDTLIAVGSIPCGADLALADDDCGDTGLQSEVTLALFPGVYYVTVTSAAIECGDFELTISSCPAGAIDEGEPVCFDGYADTFNGGCNSTIPVFSPIACGDEVCGQAGTFDTGGSSVRDTDWYEIVLTEDTQVSWTGIATFPMRLGIIGADVTGECPEDPFFITSVAGEPGEPIGVTRCLPAGTWWMWAGPSDFTGVACGSEYTVRLECAPCVTVGACCFEGGGCNDGMSALDCTSIGGIYQGFETTCGKVECPVFGGGGWQVEAPFVWVDSSCDAPPHCPPIGPGPAVQFEVTIPWTDTWTFSLCGAEWPTVLALGLAPCQAELGLDQGGCDGLGSQLVVDLEAGVYSLTVSGVGPACGPFELSVLPLGIGLSPPDETPSDGEAIEGAAGDLDNDGDADTVAVIPAATGGQPGQIEIFFNAEISESGGAWPGFEAGTTIVTVGIDPTGVALGDFDGDMDLDIAVSNGGSDDVTILLNDGDGRTYTEPGPVLLGANTAPSAIASGSVTGVPTMFDHLGVTTTMPDQLVILESLGDGTFMTVFTLDLTGEPTSLDPRDIDEDKDTDLVVGIAGASAATVWCPGGCFSLSPGPATIDIPLTADPVDVSAGDFDANGFADVVSANVDGNLSVALNNADGTFDAAFEVTLPAGLQLTAVEGVGLDTDSDADIAVAARDPGSVFDSVVLAIEAQVGGGGLSFAAPLVFPVDAAPNDITSADMNLDGLTDLITLNEDDGGTGGSVTVLLNVTFESPFTSCTGDITGDDEVGFADLLLLLAAWGPCPGCPEDLDDDDFVGFQDLLLLLAEWGPCS